MSELRRVTVDFLKALADPIRLEILHLLEKNNLNSSELQEELGRSQSTISKHLNLLFENGLIGFEKIEKINYYQIKNKEVIELINNITSTVLNINRKRFKNLQKSDIEDILL